MQCESCQHENAEAASFCERCGSALRAAVSYGERRQLTVLFADLANSSTLSEQLDAEDYQDLIRAYQTASVGAVTRHGATLPSSSAMASWSTLATPRPLKTQRALRCRQG